MNVLWVPESTPPLVTEAAADSVLLQMLEDGVEETALRHADRLESEEEMLADYVDRLGFALNDLCEDGDWPRRVLRIGASSAHMAYREAGYYQNVSPHAFYIGGELAKAEGIPEAYLRSLISDPLLEKLLDGVSDGVTAGLDKPGYTQVLHIGAGCTRHFLQQAIAA